MAIVKQSKSIPEQYHLAILETKENIGKEFLKMGRFCMVVRDEDMYLHLGCNSFAEYLAMVGMDKTMVYRSIDIYHKFVARFKVETSALAKVGFSKLADIAPVVNEGNYKEWVEKANSLPRTALIEEVKKSKGKPTVKVCADEQHEWEIGVKCKHCQARISDEDEIIAAMLTHIALQVEGGEQEMSCEVKIPAAEGIEYLPPGDYELTMPVGLINQLAALFGKVLPRRGKDSESAQMDPKLVQKIIDGAKEKIYQDMKDALPDKLPTNYSQICAIFDKVRATVGKPPVKY